MSIRNLISKFLTQLCEKNYAEANETLKDVVGEKTKKKVGKVIAVKKDPKNKTGVKVPKNEQGKKIAKVIAKKVPKKGNN